MTDFEKRAGEVAVQPRVTKDDVEARIADVAYVVYPPHAPVLTVAIITTHEGFTVTGESACASPENFNAQLGQDIARERAFNTLWGFEGYLLRNKLAGRVL